MVVTTAISDVIDPSLIESINGSEEDSLPLDDDAEANDAMEIAELEMHEAQNGMRS
jgi:hypothetical protein